ncbi:hypothetical protein PENTCL1PPCAC_5453, partial [Pristionchus entomophagus]
IFHLESCVWEHEVSEDFLRVEPVIGHRTCHAHHRRQKRTGDRVTQQALPIYLSNLDEPMLPARYYHRH